MFRSNGILEEFKRDLNKKFEQKILTQNLVDLDKKFVANLNE
jgi:hypothetical protein